ncbi:ABC-F family ATP-binding cassette domain-containing protein [Amphibacillus sp. MSJ-3]|uniref:ABC-F family ATP-binding cassette domain-containing protein n=1 Tax=Amphibacillus sp. MSJ-3 TaxID=2841505 RepID=UPI001C0F203E|nr:ABC-F family ATP-binding cassette domain-containing protein [Amphibacillus sp. MSJ-3]MBU5595347.1 ABC-F family ATP-binding cassette domain-containing protein [Amphibacillus sp. MSJ-3]
MILMQINQLVKHFGAETILKNIKLEVKTHDRIAIVGRNGAGKSTLLKIMAGQLPYDEGEIHRVKDMTLGYLDQHTGLETEETIWNEMRSVFHSLIQEEKALREMELEMGNPDLIADTERYQQLLNQYDQRIVDFKARGGYQYESDIQAVLHGLNFSNYDFNTPILELSGGQKTRLALGKLLLSRPDLLILDEPTNHLDITTLNWLEQFLKGYQGAVVIVSHDRYFLDKTVDIVYEISHRQSKKYHGNYTKYLEQKALDYQRELRAFNKQQAEIKKTEDFIQRNLVRASTTKRAQSRRKQLEKMERIDQPKGEEASASFHFDIKQRSGNDVLRVNHLAFRYPGEDQFVFSQLNFKVNRQDRIALVGPNGVGKTTLIKTIIGDYQASHGEIILGTNVEIGYYDQEQAKLHSNKTALMELWDDYPQVNEQEIRTILGNFLFSGDDVLKPVSTLSGGEKARLALAKLMMQKANLLILDEPTNHLDLDSKEILEAALINYPGTIIFVSHDRYFINEIATHVIEQAQDGVTVYLGDYDYYVDKKQETAEIEALNQQESNKPIDRTVVKTNYHEEKLKKQEARKRMRKIEEIEQQIEQLETIIANNDALLIKPEVYQDHQKALEITEHNQQLNEQIEGLMEVWEALQE